MDLEQLEIAIVAASVARQAHDYAERGMGPPTDSDYDDFLEEGEAIALETISAYRRTGRR